VDLGALLGAVHRLEAMRCLTLVEVCSTFLFELAILLDCLHSREEGLSGSRLLRCVLEDGFEGFRQAIIIMRILALSGLGYRGKFLLFLELRLDVYLLGHGSLDRLRPDLHVNLLSHIIFIDCLIAVLNQSILISDGNHLSERLLSIDAPHIETGGY
jgi:hypothetical protein